MNHTLPVRMARTQQTMDRVAMGASMLCVLHCMAAPMLIVLAPVLAGPLLADKLFHLILTALVLPTSVIALCIGCRRHRDGKVLLLGITGLTALISAALWGHELLGEAGEKVATVAGSLAIVVGHWRNFQLCRSERCAN